MREITDLNIWGHAYIAAGFAQTDRMEEANAELQILITEFQRRSPERDNEAQLLSLNIALKRRAERYRVQSEGTHFLEGLHKAGLAE